MRLRAGNLVIWTITEGGLEIIDILMQLGLPSAARPAIDFCGGHWVLLHGGAARLPGPLPMAAHSNPGRASQGEHWAGLVQSRAKRRQPAAAEKELDSSIT